MGLLAEFGWPECVATCVLIISGVVCIMWCYYWMSRTERIESKGWPPPHCDADGDQVEKDK